MTESEIKASSLPGRFSLDTNFMSPQWRPAAPLALDRDWRGLPAPPQLHTLARALWTQDELIFGFECGYTELDVDTEFDPTEERYALWDRDVCEAFVRSPLEPAAHVYKEFEVAPTGQWCDLRVDREQGLKDWEWRSGLRTAHEINEPEKVWRVAMAIPFAAFGVTPRAGDDWHANLFRISRLAGERQYLAYSPTLTERPNFHVPAAFVKLKFTS
jgi:alpha-galactosidase